MNPLKINIKRSVSNKKLNFDTSIISKVLKHSLIPANLLFFLYITSVEFYDCVVNSNKPIRSLVFLLLVITVIIIYFVLLNESLKLNTFKGNNKIENQKLLSELAKIKKWKVDYYDSELEIIRVENLKTLADYDDQIIIIYNKNDIYVNYTSLTIGNEPNPFKYFKNKKATKEIINSFKALKHYTFKN